MKKRTIPVVIGGIFWVALISSGFLGVRRAGVSEDIGQQFDESLAFTAGPALPGESVELNQRPGNSAPARIRRLPVGRQLMDYWTSSPQYLQLSLPEVPAKDGDPIFALTEDGRWIQAGYLNYTDSGISARKATAVWHSLELASEDCRFEYHRNRGKFGDIVRLLLPREKREKVEAIIRESIENDGEAIAQAMRPIVTRSMQESLPVVEQAFRQSISKHRVELEAVGERYRKTVLDERLVPLMKDEVLPVVKLHAEPLAQQIGKELWDRASVWRFGWRFLYDRTPLPDRDLVRREWDRFVEEEAIQVVESHTDEMLEAQRRILRDLTENQKIRSELSLLVTEISRDKELRDLVTVILRESVVENKELRRVWMEQWQSAEAKAALKLAGDRLEPVVRKIGDELFGTRDQGISPSFARVLRNQILGKDKRWLVAVRNSTPVMQNRDAAGVYQVTIGENDLPFPLTIMAAPDELFSQ